MEAGGQKGRARVPGGEKGEGERCRAPPPGGVMSLAMKKEMFESSHPPPRVLKNSQVPVGAKTQINPTGIPPESAAV